MTSSEHQITIVTIISNSIEIPSPLIIISDSKFTPYITAYPPSIVKLNDLIHLFFYPEFEFLHLSFLTASSILNFPVNLIPIFYCFIA